MSALESQLTISIEEEHFQKASSNHRRGVEIAPQDRCDEVNASLLSALEELNGVQYGVEPTSVSHQPPATSHATPSSPHHQQHVRQRPSSTGLAIGRVSFQKPCQDADSAYSDDNSSLPSSGSRVSVATSASSSNSATSSGMGVSNTTSPTSEPYNSTDVSDIQFACLT